MQAQWNSVSPCNPTTLGLFHVIKNWKTILLLALPSVLAFASATLTGTLNLIVIGGMGALAIAAVGVSNIVIYNAWALFSGIGHTVNYLVAQSYGAGDIRKSVERFYIALYVSLAMGVLVFVVGLLFADDILRVIGGSHDISASGAEYLKIRFFAMAFGIVTFAFQGFFRGIGDTRTPMVLSLVSNIVMVILTYALTYGKFGFPEWA